MVRYFSVKKGSKKMYAGTYNFKDLADGTSGTDIVAITQNQMDTCTILSDFQGHRKVLYGTSATAWHNYRIYFTGIGVGTIEFWVASGDITKQIDFYLYESGTALIVCNINANLNIGYGDGVGGHSWSSTAAASDTFYHLKFTFDCTTDTFSAWLDGVSKLTDEPFYDDRTADSINQFWGHVAVIGAEIYIDAMGFSDDTDYNIGDNIHYRHFKESTDSFEGNDVGTQGTSITWVDAVDTAASTEIVQEFNEHKKILRNYYSSGAGGSDYCYHLYASQAKTGWFECWWKVSNVALIVNGSQIFIREGVTSIVLLGIQDSQFEVYTGGAWRQVTGSPTPVNDTWYHIYVQWYDGATDTFDLWIDNILYEDGTNCQANQTSGINRVYFYNYNATAYGYLDAPTSSLDSDERADNRTFDYHDPYTKTDITTDVIDVINYENKIYGWRKATIISKEEYEFTNEFFQIYDVNSKLTIEGEIKNRIQDGALRRYPLRDKNYDDLMERITHTFTTDKIHDPTDSTSMLKTALPNLDHTDGDLLLTDADTEASTYSPVLKNYPTHMFLRDISDLGDTVTIVKSNGVVILDDDLASGDTLDIDTAAHKDKFVKPPHVVDILEHFNYLEIFGAINPDTGERFYKVIDNSGNDKPHKWRYVNNDFRTQTDVDAYATALDTRITTIKIITIEVQDLGAHNMGETLNLKYVSEPYNIPQANYYIINEKYKSMNTNSAIITLSEGLIEESKYSATFERPEEYVNSYASEIYETDLITIYPHIFLGTGAVMTIFGMELDTSGDFLVHFFHLDDKIDSSRNIEVTWVWKRIDGNNDTVAAKLQIDAYEMGGAGHENIELLAATTLPACAANEFNKYKYTFATADLYDDYQYYFALMLNEAARTLRFTNIIVKYYQKRSV